jgi:hypothetical protein
LQAPDSGGETLGDPDGNGVDLFAALPTS